MANRDAIAVIEFSLELDHFFNIDLYVGGYYQLRCQLKTAKKLPSKIDVSIPRSAAPQLFPASVVNGKAVGTAFEILYKEEDVSLSDIIEYKAFVPLRMSKIPNVLQFHLALELWYIDKDEMLRKGSSDVFASFECVSKRHLILNFPMFRGLHYHRPVIFDYFHLCSVTVTVHGSVVALEKTNAAVNALGKQPVQRSSSSDKQKGCSTNTLGPNVDSCSTTTAVSSSSASPVPSLSRFATTSSLASSPEVTRKFAPGSANMTSFEEAVFGTSGKASSPSPHRLQNAYQFHRSVCQLLLTAYEALELKLTQLLHCLPSRYQIRIQSVDCAKKFEILQQNLQRIDDESELLAIIDGNIALLSGELTLLWKQFLELFRGREEIRQQLSKEHHTARVRRFAEGFLSGSECASTSSLIDFNNVSKVEKTYERLEDQLRKSAYFQRLPPLNFYCEDLDGSAELLPVVFEQRYLPAQAPSTPPCTDQFKSIKHSQSAKLSSVFSSLLDNASKHKDLLKGALSLDLPHVHRPAVLEPKPEAEEVASNEKADSVELEPAKQRDEKRSVWMMSTRKQLLTRSTSFRLWLRHRRHRTIPMANSEVDMFDSERPRALTHRHRIRSAPELKPVEDSVAACQPAVSAATVATAFEKTDEATAFVSAFALLSRRQTAASEAEDDETLASAVDNGHAESMEPMSDGSQPGDERKWKVGVSFGLDSLALENEQSLITSPTQMPSSADSVPRLTSGIEQHLLEFVSAKEHYKVRMRDATYDGHLCSDFATFPSTAPYFLHWNSMDYSHFDDIHLVVCVHGLDGTCADLRMVRAYIELCLPDRRIEFLMSKRNQMDTFNGFETMTRNLVDELLLYLSHCSTHPTRISFIGHSLGNVIVRSALADPRLEPWLERLYTFLSLNGPHCGILYNNNSVVNMGIWFVQRWKKSLSLQQMALKDNADLRQTFMYQLSMKPCLQYFKYVLLVGSHDDFYVPMHSALIQLCRPAMKDNTLLGQVYTEIVHNIMLPLLNSGRTTVVRYSVFHAQQASSTTSHLLGRAAHIAVLDSDLFIEKLLTVSALRYFR